MNLAVDVGEVVSMGAGPLGERRVVNILGGTFEGPAMRGEEVDPAAYFFRTIMRFETGAPYLEWLNRTIAVATAERQARRVLLHAYTLL